MLLLSVTVGLSVALGTRRVTLLVARQGGPETTRLVLLEGSLPQQARTLFRMVRMLAFVIPVARQG